MREITTTNYPPDWDHLKIQFFNQIKFPKETPENLDVPTFYYLKRFDRYRQKKFWFSMNWPAFLFTSYWILYRRLYDLNLSFFFWIILLSGLYIMTEDYPLLTKTFLDALGIFLLIPFFILLLLFYLIFPFIANRLYIDRILSRIKENKPYKKPGIINILIFSIFVIVISVSLRMIIEFIPPYFIKSEQIEDSEEAER